MTTHEAVLGVITVLFLCAASPLVTEAQETVGRDSVLNEFAADVADLQRQFENLSGRMTRESYEGVQIDEFEMLGADSASIIETGTVIRAEPNENARALRTLDEGTRVRLLLRRGEWYEVLVETSADTAVNGWLPANAVRPDYQVFGQAMMAGGMLSVWESVIAKANDLRDKYADNPYVRLTGFDVEIGVPPSLSVGFEFK